MLTKSTSLSALLLTAALALPSAAFAIDTSTAATMPDAGTVVTNEAPPGLKEYVAEQNSWREKSVVVVLILIMTGAGMAASFLMTKRAAEADRMIGDSYNRWMRDRSMGHRRE